MNFYYVEDGVLMWSNGERTYPVSAERSAYLLNTLSDAIEQVYEKLKEVEG